jgi:N-acetylmuramoyl-L-alanine amidase
MTINLKAMTQSLIAVLLISLSASAFSQSANVKSVRLWDKREYTRAVLELSETAEYKVFTLENPSRLVLDIKGARTKKMLSAGAKGFITGIRSGQTESGQLRVVFDLNETVRPKTFMLTPGGTRKFSLVLDLYPQSSVAAAPVVQTAPASDSPREVVIAIDAGHGGNDPGAIGPKGTFEKTVTLAVARALAERIDNEPGMKAFLVRDSDDYIVLDQRYESAREAKADLFISIHADAFTLASVRGSSVFILSQRGASNEAAGYLADRENRADLVGGVSLNDKDSSLAAVLLDLSLGATLEASSVAADSVLKSLGKFGKTHKRYIERANFVVLRSPDVPSMLIETGFISNPTEEKNLNSAKHRGRLADAILDGVRAYFYAAPPPGSWIAKHARSKQHTVGAGETLSEIATRHGTSVSRIRAANNLQDDIVRTGSTLKIPTDS